VQLIPGDRIVVRCHQSFWSKKAGLCKGISVQQPRFPKPVPGFAS
jgi:hypothetical protein